MPDTFTCPVCGGSCEADFVDIGVGEQRVSPWACPACEWIEPVPDVEFDITVDDAMPAALAPRPTGPAA